MYTDTDTSGEPYVYVYTNHAFCTIGVALGGQGDSGIKLP